MAPRNSGAKGSTPPRAADHLPLTHLSFHVLLALAGGDRHGYGIIKAVKEGSGVLNPGTGTFYSALKRMEEEGLVTEVPPPAISDSEDSRRRYYGVTRLGREVLAAETSRLEALVRESRRLAGDTR